MDIVNRLKDFFTVNEADEDDIYYDEDELGAYELEELYSTDNRPMATHQNNSLRNRERAGSKPITGVGKTKNNVIDMPGIMPANPEIALFEPHSFAEMPMVIQALRERRSVLLNLNMMEPEEAQRAVDFVAGGTYAIDGNQERIGESIFLFTPSCVEVSSQSGMSNKETTTSEPISPHQPVPTPSWTDDTSRIA